MDRIDRRRERAALNQSLFREVNERIRELAVHSGELRPDTYICECLSTECAEPVDLSHDQYERLRERGRRFFVLPGHEDPAVEDVVEATEGYLVVEMTGVCGEVAESMNPRRVVHA